MQKAQLVAAPFRGRFVPFFQDSNSGHNSMQKEAMWFVGVAGEKA
jgi:hypothetical protein